MSAFIAITGSGLITSVGNNSASSCAAIRCSLDNTRESRFLDSEGEPVSACLTELDEECQGEARLVLLAVAALKECLDSDQSINSLSTPLILCLPERGRPGRPIKNDDEFFADIQEKLGKKFSPQSLILNNGHIAAAVALRSARQLLDSDPSIQQVLIASADSLVSKQSLEHLEENDRLLTSLNSDGLIPGEAGAALTVKRTADTPKSMHCLGFGFSMEPAPILSGKPCRADGLSIAIRNALEDAQIPMQDMAYRITDLTGEHYYFREAALALSRTLRVTREDLDLLHPADCVGDTGTTLGLVILAYQRMTFIVQPPELPQVLLHLSDDDGRRAAIVLGSS